MDVLIKGMQMPKKCEECKMLRNECTCVILEESAWQAVQWGKRRIDCPLEEIPPHGRLIDADKRDEWKYISMAPTIIEASE